MLLQVKDVLSPDGFLYMVTVMDNKPAEILQLLAEDGIKGVNLLANTSLHRRTNFRKPSYLWCNCCANLSLCSHLTVCYTPLHIVSRPSLL